MKKRNMIAALLCSACLVAGSVNPVFADASKVVTLGADLSDAQKQTMMKYRTTVPDRFQNFELCLCEAYTVRRD